MADARCGERSTLNRRQLLQLSTAAGLGAALPHRVGARDRATPPGAAAPGTCSTPRSAVAKTQHGKVRGRGEKAIVKAIVAKGRDRNEHERKFINGLSKANLAAQPDGTVIKSEGAVATVTEDGTPAGGAPRRQQPKRQSKSQRQAQKQGDEPTSLTKSDAPEDAKPAAAKKPAQKSSGQGRSKAQSGQRKGGPQRPKSPSKK